MELGLNFPSGIFGRESEVIESFRTSMYAHAISAVERRDKEKRLTEYGQRRPATRML